MTFSIYPESRKGTRPIDRDRNGCRCDALLMRVAEIRNAIRRHSAK